MEVQQSGEGVDPLVVLPAELWFKILDNIVDHQDPRDLIDASKSCRLFEHRVRDHVNSHKLAEVAPMILKWLGHADLLNLRCVSKRVTKSVDAIFDNVQRVEPNQHLGLFQSRFLPPAGVISPSFENDHFGALKKSGVYWGQLAHVEQFHREKEAANLTNSAERRPMIGRTLHMWPWKEGFWNLHPGRGFAADRACLDRFIQYLPAYSETLRHVNMMGMRCTGDLIRTYDVHRSILTALPNLYTYHASNTEKPNVAAILGRLKKHIAQNPLPPMRYLEKFSFQENHPVPVPVVQEVCVRYGAQLKRLRVDIPANKKYGDVTALRTLPALTHLKISNNMRKYQEKQPPVILMNVQANNLVDLGIKIEMVHTSSVLPEVVQYLKRFPRLAGLSLDLSYMLLLNGVRSQTILATGARYPSVKQLKIKTTTNQLPLTFFVGLFPNLESLSLEFKRDYSRNNPNLASGEFENDLTLLKGNRGWQCAVWESCPSLKVLRFQDVGSNNVSEYVRDAYKQQQIGNQQRRQFFRQIRLPNADGEDDDDDEDDDE